MPSHGPKGDVHGTKAGKMGSHKKVPFKTSDRKSKLPAYSQRKK